MWYLHKLIVFVLISSKFGDSSPAREPRQTFSLDEGPFPVVCGQIPPGGSRHPWMVGILRNGVQVCSGSLLDNIHILTAASCLETVETENLSELRVNLGEGNKEKGTMVRKVKRVSKKRGFTKSNTGNDIALIQLTQFVPFDKFIQPICLFNDSAVYDDGEREAMLLGYGTIDNRKEKVDDDSEEDDESDQSQSDEYADEEPSGEPSGEYRGRPPPMRNPPPPSQDRFPHGPPPNEFGPGGPPPPPPRKRRPPPQGPSERSEEFDEPEPPRKKYSAPPPPRPILAKPTTFQLDESNEEMPPPVPRGHPERYHHSRAVKKGKDTKNKNTKPFEEVKKFVSRRFTATRVRVLSNNECSDKYLRFGNITASFISDATVCAAGEGDELCQADIGSPLLVKIDNTYQQIGVLSWNIECDANPGVFSRVDSYMDWIAKKTLQTIEID